MTPFCLVTSQGTKDVVSASHYLNKAGGRRARPDSGFMQHGLVLHTLKSFQSDPMQGQLMYIYFLVHLSPPFQSNDY